VQQFAVKIPINSDNQFPSDAIDIAAYDDSNIREYLVFLVSNYPESFDDYFDENLDYVRPYGPIR